MTAAPPLRQIDSWRAAEENAADWMRHWGHSDAVVTASGPDGGVDVRASDALAQVKWEARQTGTPALQRLVGARRNHHDQALLFFSGAGYSAPAVEYADDMDIALFKYDMNGRMRPISLAAHRVVLRAEPNTSVPHAGPVTAGLGESPIWSAPTRQPMQKGRGWWGRNWAATVAGFFLLFAVGSAQDVISNGGDSTWDWWDPFVYLLLAAPFAFLWIRTRGKRRQWKQLDEV